MELRSLALERRLRGLETAGSDRISKHFSIRVTNSRHALTTKSPFFEAARNNQITALEILHNAGANREARDGDQNTPLIIAAKAGKLEAVEWLLDHGADIYAKAERGKTALDWAKANGHQKIAELLQSRMGA